MRTKLPEKWCINREGNQEIMDWCTKNTSNCKDMRGQWLGWFFHFPCDAILSHTYHRVKSDWEEITPEEFEILVLGKQATYEIY